MPHTAEELAKVEVTGPVLFADGARGMARQEFQAVGIERLRYVWSRKDRDDKGRTYWAVDGTEVADLAHAAEMLNRDPDPESPAEQWKRWRAEQDASPKLAGRARRARNVAECAAHVAPVGQFSMWRERVDHAWHTGINHYADDLRHQPHDPGTSVHPYWLYDVKYMTGEMSRLQHLWAADRKEDQELICALGTRCRDCPILQQIELSLIEARIKKPFPQPDIEDGDIDLVKTMTCIGHVLSRGGPHSLLHDGCLITNKRDRED